jgi:hypothetical protein
MREMQSDPADTPYLTAFENQPIRTVIVKNWKEEKVLYIIFHRLNTNSVPLSPQELRQALHPGPFLSYAAQYSESSQGLQQALNITKPDFRMRDVELLIRSFAFRNYLPDYRGNLKEFLDKTCRVLNKQWKHREGAIRGQAQDLECAISTTFKIFGGDGAFRKWDGSRFERRFNRAAFDIMVYYFSQKRCRQEARAIRQDVRETFKRLCTGNAEFLKSLETTTKSVDATAIRFTRWGRRLRRLGLHLQVPKLKYAKAKRR